MSSLQKSVGWITTSFRLSSLRSSLRNYLLLAERNRFKKLSAVHLGADTDHAFKYFFKTPDIVKTNFYADLINLLCRCFLKKSLGLFDTNFIHHLMERQA